ncbi:hypothetical protein pdam_00020147 [Pocillopora damicornis]|uniref:TIR domain-containing protein n=1 Tax=Pocillopora damicornis TaxID=46731 RepID=A0A3M6T9N1_POCDA|nr:hypothetical protein pdam_00020147 [Pocillopora damicornis]
MIHVEAECAYQLHKDITWPLMRNSKYEPDGGASKTTGKAIETHARSIEIIYHSEERHNKLSQDAKSANGNVKDECDATTREGKPVTDRFSAENEQMTKDDGDEKILISSLCENDPQLETRLSSTNRYYQSLNKAFYDGNLLTEPSLEHAKALIDVYSKCRKRSNKTVVTDFALAVGIHKLVYDIIVDRRKEDEEKVAALKMSQDIINHLLAVIMNFTDLHDSFCLACSDLGMVQILIDMTKDLQDTISYHVKYVNPKTQYLSKYSSRGKMLNRTLGVLHNLSKRVPTRMNFAACQALDILIPLLKAEVALFGAKSLLVLACLIDEDNNHLIMADEGPIKFLTTILRKAIGSTTHRYLGLSASELAEGLAQIAVNDNNKKTIGQCEAVPILVKMLQNAKGNVERLNACNTLWTLAFDEENRQMIRSDDYALFELRKLLTTSEDSEIKRAAAGALWECEGKEKHAEEKQQTVTLEQISEAKHVMISYQWDVQKLVIQIKNKLQADGFKVWMDIDEMGGSTLESMAKAVENASVILVCVSQKYKESPNCRSEAEYTYQLHKDVIPLMMDGKYRPDGWLGFIVGSKFWIDFSEKHKLDSSLDTLIRELGNRGKFEPQEPIGKGTGIKPVAIADSVDASPQTSIKSWTCGDVKKWLNDVGLENRLDPKAVQRLDGQMLLRLQGLRKELVGVLLNFSDLHDQFCVACSNVGMVQIFVEMTKELKDAISHNVKFVVLRGRMLSNILGVLHNLSKRVPTRVNFAACQALDTLIPLLKAEVALFGAKCLLILAYLIDESNNHMIMADEGPIKLLTNLLKMSLSYSNHRCIGFSSSELAEGLTQIAVNDNNKKMIAKCGAIQILVRMLQTAKDNEEKLNACNAFWTLAFDEENQREIKANEQAISELEKLLTDENIEIQRAAAGALWECNGKERYAEEKKQKVGLQQITDAKHVMISYQWDVQKLVIQIKNKLEADGFKVWMDIDEMGGSTLESMAKAVENASVVLVCVSQKYKESPNCRSEAEYTYQLRKDVIPLMVDGKYRPDGWLGFIVGSKFWIDFSEKHKLDSNVTKLVKELGTRGKIEVVESIVQAAVEDVVDASPHPSIRSWTCSDVKTWLKAIGLENRLDSKALQRLDGRRLQRLHDLRKESPEFFYSSIKTDLKLGNVFDVLDFVDELENLME